MTAEAKSVGEPRGGCLEIRPLSRPSSPLRGSPRCPAAGWSNLAAAPCIVRSQAGSRGAVCGDNKPTSVSLREAYLLLLRTRDIYMRPVR